LRDAANDIAGLEHRDSASLLHELIRGRETGRSGADDDDMLIRSQRRDVAGFGEWHDRYAWLADFRHRVVRPDTIADDFAD
jgi:hypothetical protein